MLKKLSVKEWVDVLALPFFACGFGVFAAIVTGDVAKGVLFVAIPAAVGYAFGEIVGGAINKYAIKRGLTMSKDDMVRKITELETKINEIEKGV